VIRNSGVNQDGKTSGITLPSGEAQSSLIARVYKSAGLNPLETTYVEAHGTGTPAGDPIEASALSKVFSPGRPQDRPLHVGSIKTNIGHLEGASGLAGVIKAVLMLENKMILPNTNFEIPNSRIPLDDWRLNVSTGTDADMLLEANQLGRFPQNFFLGSITASSEPQSTASDTAARMHTSSLMRL
jgi:acyl transferase domain-containing protein